MTTILLVLACTAPTDSRPSTDAPDDSGDAANHSGDSGDSRDSGGGDSHTGDSAPAGPPRVILFIGDGMGLEQVKGGGLYANGAAGSLGLEALPFHGTLRTASLTGVTDSAASGTVMATGGKTWNGHIGIDADGVILRNLVEDARARGMATGVVTTDRLSGATPSSFLVHTEDRFSYPEIAAEIAATLPDIALAGGLDDFSALLDPATVDLVTTGAELDAYAPSGRPLVGLFAPSTFPYVADGYADLPTLADMTLRAIDALDDDPDGYFLMVEGARIDHASHGNDTLRVFPEVVAFDEAITAARGVVGDDATLLVTADHECGGLHVLAGHGAGVAPDAEWRNGGHTNADVGVWGAGPLADAIDGRRLDNAWVHAVLAARIAGTDVVAPDEVPLIDGTLTDLAPATVTQPWASSFDAAFNRMDALHVDADADGLRIGIDGVFEDDANAVIVYVDVDYGDGTGWPRDGAITDTTGAADSVLAAVRADVPDPAFGAERALISVHGEQAYRQYIGGDAVGLRDLTRPDDLGWIDSGINFDSGNLSLFDAAAPDAGAADEGFEAQIPWVSLYGTATPGVERRIAVVALLVNDVGAYISNQALPPLASADEPGAGTAVLPAEVELVVDATGAPTAPTTLVP